MKKLLLTILTVAVFSGFIKSQPNEIGKASVLVSENIKSPVKETLVKMLKEEVLKRTSVEWKQVANWGAGKETVIAVVLSSDNELAGVKVPVREGENLPETKPEGYRIISTPNKTRNIIWIIGADARGTMFGAGKLLRTMNWANKKVLFDKQLDFASSPMQSIRGHQLGYRNTANSYDAWDVAQYDQYIRELVIFGTNAVEVTPTNNIKESVHYKMNPDQMDFQISNICKNYGIDYWIWQPATFDLKDAEKRKTELELQEIFYKNCPKISDVFFPGGDPGDNHPRDVMPFLKDLHDILVKYHPEAGIWISLQGFSAEQVDFFYTWLNQNKPDWLRGIVSGPSSPPTAETRFRLDPKYRHRLYPDITHNVRCEYPVTNWDQALMLTIGREGINPRPTFSAKIHKQFAPFIDGFVSYSDGCHDDVNKVIWSMRGWDINLEPQDILTDYCRFHFGPKLADKCAIGIMALESNWVGPVKSNSSIDLAFDLWKKLEGENLQLAGNWRWQMFVVRAYYDEYQKKRKIYETGLEDKANEILANAPKTGAEQAMQQALVMVEKADNEPVAQDLHAKIVKYCDDLFKSIGYQSDVEKYKASNSQRSCILQFVNYPLNNRLWLEDQFALIAKMLTEQEKLDRLEVIRTWENPGQGSYYDNISNIETSPHCTTTSYDATDVAWWDGGMSRKRLSSQLFQQQPELNYENLDPNGRYRIRISGRGDALLRVDGERLDPISYDKEIGGFKEFVIPANLVGDGKLHVSFDRPEESKIRWTQQSHVSDVWLLKQH